MSASFLTTMMKVLVVLFGFHAGDPFRRHISHRYIGIMEKKMETTIIYWGYIGIMEKNMETTIILGLYRDNGKENGNYYYIGV